MGFNINSFLNDESKKEIKSDWKPVKLSVHKLRPAAGKENFYHMDDKEVEETARTIELVGIQQYPVVKPVEGTDEYEIIAGHKRRLAVLRLIAEGKTEYEMIPCKIESAADSIRNRLILIFTNSTQRERTDYEKMQEIKEVRKLLEEWQKNNELSGKLQNIIAEVLGTNKTKVGTLEHIDGKLIEPFKEEFAAGKISTHAANEIAGLDEAAQQALYETYKETGTLTAKDAKAVKEPEKEQEPPKEPEKEAEAIKNTPEPKKSENEAQDEPQPQFMNEPETKVTYNQPLPDNTDRKSLIISGRINPNKEYNGMNVKYFADAITNSDLFDNDFWSGWVSPDISKPDLIREYQGVLTAFTASTGEPCQVEITDKVTVKRTEAAAVGEICFKEFAEIVDALILTKVVTVQREEIDIPYWIKETAREIAGLAIWATENELSVLQDIALKMKERAGK